VTDSVWHHPFPCLTWLQSRAQSMVTWYQQRH